MRDLIGRDDIDAAYRIQFRNIVANVKAGRTVVGRKIGLTSRAVQQELGVTMPDFGFLLDNVAVSGDGVVDSRQLLQPRIEPEIALILAADISEPVSMQQAVALVSEVRASFEILDSRIAGWDISLADTIADNASFGSYVLGDSTHPTNAPELGAIAVTMKEDGERVPNGQASDAFDSVWEALTWLANTSLEHGSPLRAGDIILTGSLGPVIDVKPGSTYTASISGIGYVTATFTI
ncbi:2-keto-4-pentenoate hydratase [Rhodococcus sp. IEGM 1330]|uniref:2-keto-4-pentenoate hydratase n=1 Tax=Rhodococcus sp. IEGM 1330 TaxID=3082225 RepID=UPI002953725E|nr:fumarylacetoacetate hydrolase family protein [Rhodococcus sp. IEGM 1330]MDV8020083.1 fumarylacetoacetate hydrolase family protein [Rhodococcus sp. IEGM 1330]